jgi:predicted nucleotidyltransferase
MRMTAPEHEWLNAYRQALGSQYPGAVEEVLIYGSKARGDAGPDSDLDVLLIVPDRAGGRKRALRRTEPLLPNLFVWCGPPESSRRNRA